MPRNDRIDGPPIVGSIERDVIRKWIFSQSAITVSFRHGGNGNKTLFALGFMDLCACFPLWLLSAVVWKDLGLQNDLTGHVPDSRRATIKSRNFRMAALFSLTGGGKGPVPHPMTRGFG